ncbi:hypothetical protein [Polyangium fumosum]|uniref:Outer membrane protein beta-barrel domain-containing protein n=1 Tax=Polyangium fumosum TaxID=889272 RepID=A0A4U1JE91_9BACT|nr:hypothetical protein [Polyangium fumosum]TKD08978.1 hypothetical protein E8A74_14455 [Polyangium fumosum]
MRRNLFLISVIAGLGVVGFLPSTARAGLSLGADMNVGVVTSGAGPVGDVGSGIGGRIGYRANLGPFAITPEIGGSYLRLNAVETPMRGVVGGRLALRGMVQPSIFAHYGIAIVQQDVRGPTYDLGAAVDLSAAIVRVGVHAGYVAVQSTADRGLDSVYVPLEWVELGLHAGLGF